MDRFKIFLIEDDEIIAKSLKKFLENWSYEVYLVKDYEKVFEEYERIDPAIILIDISLPFFNGYYWCEKLEMFRMFP